MPNSLFYKYLVLVTVGCSAVLAALHFLLEPMRQHWSLSVACIIVFVVLSLGLYFASLSAAKSTSKVAFNGLISGSVFGKMVLAIAVLFIYQNTVKPDNQWFVGIFLFIYVVFTVFEVWFMTKLARIK